MHQHLHWYCYTDSFHTYHKYEAYAIKIHQYYTNKCLIKYKIENTRTCL